MTIKRKHSIFGDYLTGSPPDGELKEAQAEISDYNTLWSKYVSEISGEWGVGSLPTEKGFNEWVQRHTVGLGDSNKITKEES